MDKRTLRQRLWTSRRGWLAQASGLALGAVVAPTFASVGAQVPVSGHAATKGLNGRRDGTDEEWLIQGATIVGTSPAEAVSIGDIHVRDGVIVAVGEGLSSASARVLPAHGMMAMPGLVDRHWHMWNSLARGYAPGSGTTRFFQALQRLSPHFTPADSRLAVRFALAEAVNSGITTVTNWAHNIRGPAWADAEVEALFESGLSGRFLYGYPQDLANDKVMDLQDVLRLKRHYFDASPEGAFFDIGVAMRGPERTPASVWRREGGFAMAHGLPFSMHISVSKVLQQQHAIQQLSHAGLLGPRTELVHVTHADARDWSSIVESDTQVVVTPLTEMRVGYGVTPIETLLNAGVTPGVGVDTTVLSGDANLFNVIRTLAMLADGQAENERFVSPAQALRWATVDGAGQLGNARRAGMLAPGKQADILLIDSRGLNVSPVTDVESILTSSVQPENVRTVMARGRVLKRDGNLTRVDRDALIDQVEAAWARLEARMDA